MVFYTLSVESPDSISGDYDMVPAAFGTRHLEGVLKLDLVDCGDKMNMPRRELYRKMAMVRQTEKHSDYDLCYAQQISYASGVIVICNIKERTKASVMKLTPGQKDKLTIPCYMCSRPDGQSLSKASEESTVVISLVAAVVDMYSWGTGSHGQLGLSGADSFEHQNVPRLAVQERGIQTIACGSFHTLVLLDNGTVFAFGCGEDGQLGHGSWGAASVPVFLDKLAEQSLVSVIACGANHSLAVGATSGLYSWGLNQYLQLGHSESEQRVNEPIPCPEMASRTVKFVAAGFFHSMACVVNFRQSEADRAEEKRFRAEKAKAEESRGATNSKLSKLPGWLQKAVASDDDSKMKKKEEKKVRMKLAKKEQDLRKRKESMQNQVRTLYTWGDGGHGQLGHGDLYTEAFFKKNNPKGAGTTTKMRNYTKLPKPRMIEHILKMLTEEELGVISALSAWGQQSALLTTKGKLMTWGNGDLGRLGHGDEVDRNRPTVVTGFSGEGLQDELIKQVAIGQFSMVALSRNANIYTWGANIVGQLGLPVNPDPDAKVRFVARPTPVKAASKKAIHTICCGDTHIGGVTENNEIFLWGQDEGGRLGQESDPVYPVQWVPKPLNCSQLRGTGIAFLAMGSSHTVALTSRYPADDTNHKSEASSQLLDGSEGEEGIPDGVFSACCTIS